MELQPVLLIGLQRRVSLKVVAKVPEGHLDCVLPMVVGGVAKGQIATRERKVALCIARRTEGGEDVSVWDASKVLKGRPTFALAMVEVADATPRVVIKLQGASLDCVFDMVGVRGVKKRDALRVQRVMLAYAYLMVEVVVVNTSVAERALKAAQCIARLMVEEGGVSLRDAPKVQKEVHLVARPMVVARDACLDVGLVRKVFTEVLRSV